MCAHHEKQQEPGGYNNLTVVAWTILVMGVSLAGVILLWIWFGHIGPSFSEQTLAQQQKSLREQYGLPYKPILTDPTVLQTPPSLRSSQNGGSNSTNGSSSSTNNSSK
jgi:hypothetical protein